MNSEELERGIEEITLKQKEHGAHTQNELQFTCFTELVNEANLHFQITRFPKQVFPFSNASFFNRVIHKLGFKSITQKLLSFNASSI